MRASCLIIAIVAALLFMVMLATCRIVGLPVSGPDLSYRQPVSTMTQQVGTPNSGYHPSASTAWVRCESSCTRPRLSSTMEIRSIRQSALATSLSSM